MTHWLWIFYLTCFVLLCFPPPVWWHFLSPRTRTRLHCELHRCYVLFNTSKRLSLVFVAEEAPVHCTNSGLRAILALLAVTCSGFGQAGQLFIRQSRLSDFHCQSLTSADNEPFGYTSTSAAVLHPNFVHAIRIVVAFNRWSLCWTSVTLVSWNSCLIWTTTPLCLQLWTVISDVLCSNISKRDHTSISLAV